MWKPSLWLTTENHPLWPSSYFATAPISNSRRDPNKLPLGGERRPSPKSRGLRSPSRSSVLVGHHSDALRMPVTTHATAHGRGVLKGKPKINQGQPQEKSIKKGNPQKRQSTNKAIHQKKSIHKKTIHIKGQPQKMLLLYKGSQTKTTHGVPLHSETSHQDLKSSSRCSDLCAGGYFTEHPNASWQLGFCQAPKGLITPL